MSDRVSVEVSGHVADVRLNRPDKINALDPAMFAAIVEAGEALKSDPSVRVVVLSGEGRGFCAGLDFGSFQAMAGGGERRERAETRSAEDPGHDSIGALEGGGLTHRGQQAAWVWQQMEVPVIAAIHGVALGGGCQIALGADIRLIAPDARMSVLEIRWGLTPDMSGTVTLSRLVGLDVAKELTFTGRMVEGAEAVRIGLATRLSDDPRADALALAGEIAGKSPQAILGAKRLLNQSGQVPLAQQFADERSEIGSLIGRPNQAEAVKAFFEKRDPVFQD
jgi:enoyl-CoA hydratase/carnithine racemase